MNCLPKLSPRTAIRLPVVLTQGISPFWEGLILMLMNTFTASKKQPAPMVSVGEALAAALAKVPANSPTGPFLNALGKDVAHARP